MHSERDCSLMILVETWESGFMLVFCFLFFSTGYFSGIFRIKLFYIKFGETSFYFYDTLWGSGLSPLSGYEIIAG